MLLGGWQLRQMLGMGPHLAGSPFTEVLNTSFFSHHPATAHTTLATDVSV
jgi:hypothetical protein